MSEEQDEREGTGDQNTAALRNDDKARQEAIRALASSMQIPERPSEVTPTYAPRPSMLHKPQRVSNGRAVAITITVVLVLIAGGVIARDMLLNGSLANLARSTPASVRLDINALGYSCPAAMAWSPDGSKLAVLAQKGKIATEQMSDPCVSNTILVFSSQSGSLMEHFDISAPLKAANASLTLRHDVPSWSPNGKLLALPCVVATQIPAHPVDLGVLLIPTSGSQPSIVHASIDPYQHDVTAVWDTQGSKLAAATALPLTPAEYYHIDGSGQLVASNPLVASADSTGFSGSPTLRDATIGSIWQSGALIVVPAAPNQSSTSSDARPSLVFYSAALGLWSSDGRYVDPQAPLGSAGFPDDATALKSFDPSSCANRGLAPCVQTPVPYPDRALMVIKAKLLEQSGIQTYEPDAPVAWRPDGKTLATIFPQDSFTTSNDAVRVTLLATGDGHVLKTLTTHTSSSSDTGAFDDLSWSPTGKQLAFRDTYTAAITLWGGASLNGIG